LNGRPSAAGTAFFFFIVTSLSFVGAFADDWPTYQHDNRRSGVSLERLDLPLKPAWVYTPQHPPRPAWPPPAKADFWHQKRELNPRMIFDRAYHVAVVKDSVFFGSSADDKVYCLDASSGEEKWSFFADGPVRLAPAVAGGNIYIGSDDGWVYCIDGEDGRLVWRQNPSKDNRSVLGNGRMISIAPVRTGIVVEGDVAYCSAGIFPRQCVRLAALDARTGEVLWMKNHDFSPQGYMLASADRLYVPTGRTSPVVFDKEDGSRLGEYKGSAGAYALVTEDLLIYGPGDGGQLGLSETSSRDHLATFNGLHMIVRGKNAYLHSKTALCALDRIRYLDLVRERRAFTARTKAIEEALKKMGKDAPGVRADKLRSELDELKLKIAECAMALLECTIWDQPCEDPHALILAGDLLFTGGEDRVTAYSTPDGRLMWQAKVPGRAYGMAAANGRLFVSTDRGMICCFE
jgi:outer membrane protein assembly factor BamB